jgi:hypothetical protein
MFIHLIHFQHDQVMLMPAYLDSTTSKLSSDGTTENRTIKFHPIY